MFLPSPLGVPEITSSLAPPTVLINLCCHWCPHASCHSRHPLGNCCLIPQRAPPRLCSLLLWRVPPCYHYPMLRRTVHQQRTPDPLLAPQGSLPLLFGRVSCRQLLSNSYCLLFKSCLLLMASPAPPKGTSSLPELHVAL